MSRRGTSLLRALVPPSVAIVAVAMSAAFVLPEHPRAGGLFLAARALVIFWAGVRVVTVARAGLLAAAAAGPALYFVDEVLLKGSCYLARAAGSVGGDRRAMLAAAVGVLGTFAAYVVVSAAVSFTGGLLALRGREERAGAGREA